MEIKAFSSISLIAGLEQALGQFVLYHEVLSRVEPERILYLAVDARTFAGIFAEPDGQALLDSRRLQVVVFEPAREAIVQWIPQLTPS